MNRNAYKALNLPHKSKSGAIINSRLFIVAITTTCVIALSFVLKPLKIQTAIAISARPIILVKTPAWALPMILATIS